MKAMCLPHHDITFSPHLLTFCLPICSNSATSCHVCISVSLSLFFVQGALASSCGGDNTGLQSSNHHKRSQRRTRGRATLFARQGLSKTNLFAMQQCVHCKGTFSSETLLQIGVDQSLTITSRLTLLVGEF
jgi:hypothetical protein